MSVTALLPLSHAAARLGVSEYRLRKEAAAGNIPGGVFLDGRWLIRASSLDAIRRKLDDLSDQSSPGRVAVTRREPS